MKLKRDPRRHLLRAALKINEHLLGQARRGQQADLPHSTWQDLCRTNERLRLAERRDWQAVSQSLRLTVDYTAGCLLREIESLRDKLRPHWRSNLVTSVSEIIADLMALEEEFKQFELNLRERSVTVWTAPITLEDIHLDPFRIVLRWERIGSVHPYEVIALDPHCADSHDDVTHPHVRDQQLCAGDGSSPIEAALSSGRFYDFFLLV